MPSISDMNQSAITSGQTPLILIVEDEPEIAEILKAYLERHGLRTDRAPNGQSALDLHRTAKPDLVLLDVQLPILDGWQVLAEIRHRGDTPVIMLTALDQDLDKLMGLRIGADDYVVKPFNPAEVVARVMAVLRRSTLRKQATPRSVLRVGALEADLESHEALVHLDGQTHQLELTRTEFNLLVTMMGSPKKVFRREDLLEICLPEGDTLLRTVDSHVSKLRKKLELLGLENIPATVRGVGYRLGASHVSG